MNRRNFLKGSIALLAAPAIVRASSLDAWVATPQPAIDSCGIDCLHNDEAYYWNQRIDEHDATWFQEDFRSGSISQALTTWGHAVEHPEPALPPSALGYNLGTCAEPRVITADHVGCFLNKVGRVLTEPPAPRKKIRRFPAPPLAKAHQCSDSDSMRKVLR